MTTTTPYLIALTVRATATTSSRNSGQEPTDQPTPIVPWVVEEGKNNVKAILELNTPAAQAAGADPSRYNSTNRQNLPFHLK